MCTVGLNAARKCASVNHSIVIPAKVESLRLEATSRECVLKKVQADGCQLAADD